MLGRRRACTPPAACTAAGHAPPARALGPSPDTRPNELNERASRSGPCAGARLPGVSCLVLPVLAPRAKLKENARRDLTSRVFPILQSSRASTHARRVHIKPYVSTRVKFTDHTHTCLLKNEAISDHPAHVSLTFACIFASSLAEVISAATRPIGPWRARMVHFATAVRRLHWQCGSWPRRWC